jgi:hypothetical protein
MEARPPAENRHGGAPRGERPASWDAPHPAGCGQVAPHPRDNRTSAPVGAPPAPRSGTDAITRTNPGAERAAGTMKAALFDIVRRDCGQRLMREPRLRARYDESQPEAVGWVEFLRDPTMAPQGDCCAWRTAQPNATRCWVSQEARPNLRLLREPCAESAQVGFTRLASSNCRSRASPRSVSRFARPGHGASARFARCAPAGWPNEPTCINATPRASDYVASLSRRTSTAMRCASLAAGMPQYIATRRRMS